MRVKADFCAAVVSELLIALYKCVNYQIAQYQCANDGAQSYISNKNNELKSRTVLA